MFYFYLFISQEKAAFNEKDLCCIMKSNQSLELRMPCATSYRGMEITLRKPCLQLRLAKEPQPFMRMLGVMTHAN